MPQDKHPGLIPRSENGLFGDAQGQDCGVKCEMTVILPKMEAGKI